MNPLTARIPIPAQTVLPQDRLHHWATLCLMGAAHFLFRA